MKVATVTLLLALAAPAAWPQPPAPELADAKGTIAGFGGDAARVGYTIRVPKGANLHRLEELKGDRKGQYSIRINDQWQICFVWRDGDAFDVEIADYH